MKLKMLTDTIFMSPDSGLPICLAKYLPLPLPNCSRQIGRGSVQEHFPLMP
jgi:hypothetical protein